MKLVAISLLVLATSTAFMAEVQAATLFNNSNITTGVGNGFSGANTSAIATGNGSYGSSANSTSAPLFELADDFSLSAASLVSSVVFDAYSTSTYPSPPTSPFTGATVSIWNAQPGTAGAVILFSSSTLAATAWTGVYRVLTTTLTNAQRPVFTLSVSFNNVPLVPGTYWASFDVTGVTTPGSANSIFTPPLMNTDGTQPSGNGIQSADGGSTWAATVDSTSGATNRFPLTVNGTGVPEPATTTLSMLAGLAAMVAARRRRAA